MNKLQQLAAEATDLAHPDNTSGLVFVSTYGFGEWIVHVHVANEFAIHHCDVPDAETPLISERGRDLDDVLDRVLARVQDAVCDTPCELIA